MNNSPTTKFVVPSIVASHFHLRAGDIVADLGAGAGFFISTLAQSVGQTGKVIACEIQKNLVEKIGSQARQQGLSNVEVRWCDIEQEKGIPLNDKTLDAVGLFNTLSQINDKVAVVKEIQRVLRWGGVVQVIDWSDAFGEVELKADSWLNKQAVCDLFENEGFLLEREYPAGSHHYGLTFCLV